MSKAEKAKLDLKRQADFVKIANAWAGGGIANVDGIPALSVRAPWSWLIVQGFKWVENREWGIEHIPKFRGRFLVHQTVNNLQAETFAAMQLIRARMEPKEASQLIARMPNSHSYLTGVVGEATLAAIYTKAELSGAMLAEAQTSEEQAKRDVFKSPWYVGNVALVLHDPKPWARMVPCKGQLGFFLPKA